MTEQLSDEKLHQLEGAAANYRTTYQAHLANPLDGSAVQDWDEATRQLMAVINYDEANIIAHLLARRDADLARHESDMTRAIAAWQTASVKLSEQASQQPEFHLRRVGGDEELYAPCGKDYPRGRAYYVKPVVSLVTVNCPPCDQCFDSADAATAYRDEQWRHVLSEAGVLVTPGRQPRFSPLKTSRFPNSAIENENEDETAQICTSECDEGRRACERTNSDACHCNKKRTL